MTSTQTPFSSCGYGARKTEMVYAMVPPTPLNAVESSPPRASSLSMTTLYTAYLGEVQVLAERTSNGGVKLHTVCSSTNIPVSVIDASQHKLSPKTMRYTLPMLKSLPPLEIDLYTNEYYHIIGLLCAKHIHMIRKEFKKADAIETRLQAKFYRRSIYRQSIRVYLPSLATKTVGTKPLSYYQKIYRQVVQYNSPVDVLFSSTHYLSFLQTKAKQNSVNNLPVIVNIVNVPNMDNAFFTGEYMVYGTGRQHFYALAGMDVVGHELSHGYIAGTANLEYQGHSGALNEMYADILGMMFERYMYKKFPNLRGESDWFVGEDFCVERPFLRNMRNPHASDQPERYQDDKFYADPNNQAYDHGGVHINSGIGNRCFYLLSQAVGEDLALQMFLECLPHLPSNANFMNFYEALFWVGQSHQKEMIVNDTLSAVGLHWGTTSDYRPQNPPLNLPSQSPPSPSPSPSPNLPPPCTHSCAKHCL